jgi:enoyl-CoA hydratase/carnithine racemase
MANEIIKEQNGSIGTLVINRPEKRNALNMATLLALGDALNEIRTEEKIRVVVLRGAGEKAFCAGGDLGGVAGGELEPALKALEYCLQSLIDFPLPVLAMIFGPAVGAGLELAVLSDFRIAADNARLGANLVKLGRIYYYTSTKRLLNLIGPVFTRELLLTGRIIDAPRAREINLVNWVYPADQVIEKTYQLARELAEETAPLAVKGTKAMIKKLLDNPLLTPEIEEELKIIMDTVNNSEDAREGPFAFVEKRKPFFKGS